jgi:sugar-specific transcriptional regulator TrmB
MSNYKDVSEEIKKTKEHLKDLKLNLSEMLKMEIKEVLISKGFIPSSVFPLEKDNMLVDSTEEISIDFRYIYENYSHLMIAMKRNDGTPYYTSNKIMKWFFNKDNFETYYEKHLKKIVENAVIGEKR